jgi:hypothetical protein
MKGFVRRSAPVPFRRFLGDVRRELMHRLSVALHWLMARSVPILVMPLFQEGGAAAVACLPHLLRGLWLIDCLPSYSPLLLVGSTAFFVVSCFP